MSSAEDKKEIPEVGEISEVRTSSVLQDDNLVGQNDVGARGSKRKYDVGPVKDILDQAQKRLATFSSLVMSGEVRETVDTAATNTVSDTLNHRTALELVNILTERVAECEKTIRKLNARIVDNDDAIDHIKNILFINTKDRPESYHDMCKIANRGSKEFYDTIMALVAESPKMWVCLLENGYANHLCVTKGVHILTHVVSTSLLKQYPKILSRVARLLHYVDPARFARDYESNFVRKIDQWVDRNKRSMMVTTFEDWKQFRKTAIDLGFQ